jgi:hypothetical protein
LIPSAAHQPSIPGVRELPQASKHFLQTAGMLIQSGIVQYPTIIQQVHVAVVESGANKSSAKVNLLVPFLPKGQRPVCRTDKHKAILLHHKGLSQRKEAGIHASVVKDLLQKKHLRFLFSSVYHTPSHRKRVF